jgi:DnaJ-class molecular chaperone
MRTFYEVLGVTPAAEAADITSRYRYLTREHHPDIGGDTAVFAAITEAGATLTDTVRKAAYDAWMRLMMDPCPKCKGKGCTYRQLTFTSTQTNICKTCEGRGFNERTR